MTYTLGDYELQKGDWIKFSDGWYEFKEYQKSIYGRSYNFYELGDNPLETFPCEAVLRPSIIIREKLDDILACIRDCTKFRTFPNPEMITFEEITPRKPKEVDCPCPGCGKPKSSMFGCNECQRKYGEYLKAKEEPKKSLIMQMRACGPTHLADDINNLALLVESRLEALEKKLEDLKK